MSKGSGVTDYDAGRDISEPANQALLQLVADIAGYRTRDDLVRSMSAHLRDLTPFDQLGVVLHAPETGLMYLAFQDPAGAIRTVAGGPAVDRIPVDFGPAGWVWQTQRSLDYSLADDQTHVTLQHLREDGHRAVCFVPLTTPRLRLGTLAFASRQVDRYSPSSIELMERIARLLALALEHTMQVEHLAALADVVAGERDRARLLLDVTNAVATERHLNDLLTVISRLLAETIPHHYASVTLWDAEARQLRRRALVFPEGRGVIKDGALLGSDTAPPRLVFESGETRVFRWADILTLDQHSAEVMAAERLRSVCCVPLSTARARHGTLNVARPDEDGFSPEDVRLLEQIAGQLAVAIENAIHFEQADHYRREATAQRDRLRLLLDVNNALLSRLDGQSFELSILERLRASVPHDYASLAILDPDVRALRLEAITLYDGRGLTAPRTLLPIDASPSGIAFTERKPLVFNDLSQFPEQGVSTLRQAHIQSICCIPLITRHGALGTLNVARRSTEICSPDEVELLVDVARQVAIALENMLAFREISDLKDRLNEEKLYLQDEITRHKDFKEIIGSSHALTRVLEQIRTVAPTDATVLLLGETGTGKELLARALHDLSRRRERTFVRVNGAALPAGLVESELFGYEKGAFTGAVGAKVGRLELADRGTLFLDEVGDLPLDVQPKLLRALQEREFERLGSTRVRRVDLRLVAATNRNLDEMVAHGAFRRDLYYRLNVFPIHIPPLRERPEDIPALVQHFTARFAREMGRQITTIPKSLTDALMKEQWPGNIRELENVIERAVILSRGPALQLPAPAAATPRDQARPDQMRSEQVSRDQPPRDQTAPPPTAVSSGQGLRDQEREAILRALRDAHGVIGGTDGAAMRLGIKRTTLHSKMKKLGIERPNY